MFAQDSKENIWVLRMLALTHLQMLPTLKLLMLPNTTAEFGR